MYRALPRCLILVLCLLSIVACERRQHLVEQHLLEFGTLIEITLVSDDLARAETLLADIERQLRLRRDHWHAWEDSDLTRFNRQLAEQGRAEVPESLRPLLQLSRDYHDASDGLFNPALGKLIAAYGFHGRDPDEALIDRLRRDIPRMTDLDIDAGMARSRNPHLRIDLGGIAKGYALGEIADYLEANGIENYLVNAGGDLVAGGNRFGKPWRIGIRNPFAPGVVASIELEGRHSLFTSGNYERRYRRGDDLRHHIIDPRNGLPTRGQSAATVLATDPVLADVAATVLMVDGMRQPREQSKALAVENFLVISDSREIMISQALAGRIELLSRWPVTILE